MAETRFSKRKIGFHQILLDGEDGFATSLVTLPAATAEQLPVNAGRIVELGCNDVQSTDLCDTRCEFDVSAAPRHVGCHGNTRRDTGLCDDLGLVLILSRVQ